MFPRPLLVLASKNMTLGSLRHVTSANASNCVSRKRIGNFSPAQTKFDTDEQVPLSLVLGWAFSHPRQVDKFSQIHTRQLGCDVLEYTLPSPHLFTFDQPKQEELTQRLLDRMREISKDNTDGKKRPILIHTFSMNGYTVYMHLKRKLLKEGSEEPFEIKGAIFDSGPGPWMWLANIYSIPFVKNTGYLAVTADRAPNATWTMPPCAYLYLSMFVEKWGIYRSLVDWVRIGLECRSNWNKYYREYSSPAEDACHDSGDYPLMYLYGQGDPMMPSSFMDKVIELQRSSGRTVLGQDFVTSGHITHYKSYRLLYEKRMVEFARIALDRK